VTLNVPNLDLMTLVSLSQLNPEDFNTQEKRDEMLGHLQTEDSKAVARTLMRTKAGKKVKSSKYKDFAKQVLQMSAAA